jgi:hypothetical protein
MQNLVDRVVKAEFTDREVVRIMSNGGSVHDEDVSKLNRVYLNSPIEIIPHGNGGSDGQPDTSMTNMKIERRLFYRWISADHRSVKKSSSRFRETDNECTVRKQHLCGQVESDDYKLTEITGSRLATAILEQKRTQ